MKYSVHKIQIQAEAIPIANLIMKETLNKVLRAIHKVRSLKEVLQTSHMLRLQSQNHASHIYIDFVEKCRLEQIEMHKNNKEVFKKNPNQKIPIMRR